MRHPFQYFARHLPHSIAVAASLFAVAPAPTACGFATLALPYSPEVCPDVSDVYALRAQGHVRLLRVGRQWRAGERGDPYQID